MQAKIAMIVPYFGKWPEWMDLYLYSCSKNPQVDFLFFTDCLVPATVYPNTLLQHSLLKHIVSMSLECYMLIFDRHKPISYVI